MTIYSSAGVEVCDRNMLSNGISEIQLIERAAAALEEVVADKLHHAARVLIAVGIGNNGADGLALAGRLLCRGFDVTVLTFSAFESQPQQFFARNLQGVITSDLAVIEQPFDAIIDGVFGTGLARAITGRYAEAIEKMNVAGGLKIAIDIPSGLCADSGRILGTAFCADITITFMGCKYGHLLGDGLDLCGEIIVCDIGIENVADDCAETVESELLKKCFPPRKCNVHKGTFGRCGVAAGSREYVGAGMIAARGEAAVRCGAGYTYVLTDGDLVSLYERMIPEVIAADLLSRPKLNSLAIGMGLGNSGMTRQTVLSLIEDYRSSRIILDADALNVLDACELPQGAVITPHVGELARLIHCSIDEVGYSPVRLSRDFAKKHGVIVVLKGATTIITDGKRMFLNVCKAPALAKGGSGDVLAGIMAAILAGCSDVLEGAAAACRLHCDAAKIATERMNEHAVTASDVAAALTGILSENTSCRNRREKE